MDEQQPLLLGRAKEHPARFIVLVALALAGVLAVAQIARSERLGDSLWKPASGVLLAPRPTGSSQSRYILHTACKPRELAVQHSAFFLDGSKEAYLVKHNYDTPDFFTKENALKMVRQKLPSGNEYGYVLDTDQVDFEYGFALKNTATDEWLYEIGESDSPLAYKSCTQKYGEYFNRARTLETNKASIETVFGNCTNDCSSYVDSSYSMKITDEGVTIPNCDSSTLDLGEGDDARLFTLYHALFLVDDQSVNRSPSSRDTTYNESQTQARWLLHTIEADDRSNMKTIVLDVRLQDDHIHVCQSSQMNIPLESQCQYIECASAVYDVPSMLNTGVPTSNYGMMRVQYTIAKMGDPRPSIAMRKFSNAKYLTTDQLYAPGTWGEDLDARRLIPISGGPCGQSIMNGHCVGMYTAVVDKQWTPTATEKRWILATISGHLKMVRIRVYVENGALKVQAIRAAYANSGYESTAAAAQRGPYDRDTLRSDFDVSNAYYSPIGSFSFADRFSSHGYGIGAIKWMLAPEMVPSLA